jgi:tRNA acetyltransferase TAN1
MNDFNLIVSTSRFNEEDAADEMLDLIDAFGDPDAEVEITNVRGIIVARTALDPVLVTGKLKELVASEPWEVRYILRVLPIEKVVPAELEDIQGAAGSMAARIPQDASFKVLVEKRHSELHSREIIDYVAQQVQRKVDLENPGWLLLVEIIGKHAGVSVVKPDQIFSSVIEKRESGS